MTKNDRSVVEKFLAPTNITFGGDDLCSIHVNDERFFTRAIHHGLLGIGESYMDGWWDCKKLDQLTATFLLSKLGEKITQHNITLLELIFAKLNFLQAVLMNRQSKTRADQIAESHYNLGNELYKAMLDENMNYTCGYWKNAQTLYEAQIAKLRLTCDKLYLQKDMTVLDIGCGYGAFAKFAAQHYKVKVVGINISKEQLELGKKLCHGLPVEFRLQDYRAVTGKFDRIVSLGMFEHVGLKNYTTYFKIANQCLKEKGLFLLHCIGSNTSDIITNAWTNKYIFPNGMLPSIKQIGAAIENLFIMEDWHNFGADYDRTLMSWYENFNSHWPDLKSHYNERFRRMWNYYLLTSAGSFRARYIQLWQIVLSKHGIMEGYESIR
jgi:cyclopropane-fatty-acyl-phospholipid synthase